MNHYKNGLRALGVSTSTGDSFTVDLVPSVTFGREPYLTAASITMVPGAVYRARIVVPSIATHAEIADALQKKGFADVAVWSVKSPPADWPADQRSDDSGFLKTTVLVQGRWAGGPETFDSSNVPHADFKAKWIETLPAVAPVAPVAPLGPPKIGPPAPPKIGAPVVTPVVVVEPVWPPTEREPPTQRTSPTVLMLCLAIPAVLLIAGKKHS